MRSPTSDLILIVEAEASIRRVAQTYLEQENYQVLSGGYPVTGGFSRSVVNFAAGANTGLASVITAGLIGLTVIFLTPLFYFLPNAVLAAIIMVAVIGLIEVVTFRLKAVGFVDYLGEDHIYLSTHQALQALACV